MNSLQEDWFMSRLKLLCDKDNEIEQIKVKFQSLDEDVDVLFRFDHGIVLICPGKEAYSLLNKLTNICSDVKASQGDAIFNFEFKNIDLHSLAKILKGYKIVKEEDTIYKLLKEDIDDTN